MKPKTFSQLQWALTTSGFFTDHFQVVHSILVDQLFYLQLQLNIVTNATGELRD